MEQKEEAKTKMIYTKAEALRRYGILKTKLEKQIKMNTLIRNVKDRLNQNTQKKVCLTAEKPVGNTKHNAFLINSGSPQPTIQEIPLSLSLSGMLTPGPPDGIYTPAPPRTQREIKGYPKEEPIRPREKKRKRICEDGDEGSEVSEEGVSDGVSDEVSDEGSDSYISGSSDTPDSGYSSGCDSGYDSDTSSTTESTDEG